MCFYFGKNALSNSAFSEWRCVCVAQTESAFFVRSSGCALFDMGGNVAEFTTELNPLTNGDNDATVVLRGGAWGTATWLNGAAGFRWDVYSGSASDDRGFRATLFIK